MVVSLLVFLVWYCLSLFDLRLLITTFGIFKLLFNVIHEVRDFLHTPNFSFLLYYRWLLVLSMFLNLVFT